MVLDTFDEGIAIGGIRSKNEIRTLICYILNSVGTPMSKEVVVETIQKKGLANYFETSSCFDDLLDHNNIEAANIEDNTQLYFLTENGKMIANQLESTLSYTVKKKRIHVHYHYLNKERLKRKMLLSSLKMIMDIL